MATSIHRGSASLAGWDIIFGLKNDFWAGIIPTFCESKRKWLCFGLVLSALVCLSCLGEEMQIVMELEQPLSFDD